MDTLSSIEGIGRWRAIFKGVASTDTLGDLHTMEGEMGREKAKRAPPSVPQTCEPDP